MSLPGSTTTHKNRSWCRHCRCARTRGMARAATLRRGVMRELLVCEEPRGGGGALGKTGRVPGQGRPCQRGPRPGVPGLPGPARPLSTVLRPPQTCMRTALLPHSWAAVRAPASVPGSNVVTPYGCHRRMAWQRQLHRFCVVQRILLTPLNAIHVITCNSNTAFESTAASHIESSWRCEVASLSPVATGPQSTFLLLGQAFGCPPARTANLPFAQLGIWLGRLLLRGW